MKKILGMALGLAAFAGATGAASTATAATEMRCSHQLPPAHHIAQVIDRWAAEIETLSEGEIDVQVFGTNSLTNAKQNATAVAKGSIDCAFSINPQWGKTLPIMNVTLGPFAVSRLDALKAWEGSEAAAFLEEKLLTKGVKNVVWMFTTRSTAITSSGKPLIKPEDFEGVKIRGLGPVPDSGFVAMGAAPSAMSGSKVYQALSTGVIDAGLTDISAAVTRKYFEVQDHVTVLPLFSVYFHGYVNPKWYDGLSDKGKQAVQEAGRKAAAWAIEASEESAASAPDELAKAGMKVHMATDEEIEALKAYMSPAFDKAFGEASGEDGKKLLELISKL
ncbi:TRAP transporter substrate-binding protein DctP [Sneathiella chinensis]|uniref:C4-dicarboxylate ABC transporter n=1 Tax=Sneathiella chinensis TaxID=349750 RepID=A0ABQ5U451_9PROT|nr:TRAP transporter substrate-binding protein DctP [Sneathiella chinensis]GLQ06919.1 C4-dicarboxylate ABC transporter [Sneathiella chinensis]